jgi:glycosidase
MTRIKRIQGGLFTSLIFLLIFCVSKIDAQTKPILRIDPPNWWVGMKSNALQLMISGKNIASYKALINYNDVKLIAQNKLESPDYLFLDVEIASNCKASKIEIVFENIANTKDKFTQLYELKNRENGGYNPLGLTSADLIYLLMPDRFSNGDPSNDIVIGTTQTTLNRDSMFLRHGGDLQGIINHLDYIAEIGNTALWLNPVQENNQPKESYHGYAITDHYNIDKRLGTNEKYVELSQKAHQKKLKMVMDVVPNHCGNEHYFFKHIPSKNWVHQWNEFTRTSYRAPTLLDPYSSELDKDIFKNAWFDRHMPDLNQQNPYLAKYLIQNSIWWVEYAGIDALRIDTYAYPDQQFMHDYADALFKEFPSLGMFGEIWDHGVPIQAFYTKNSAKASNSLLPGVTDFQLNFSLTDALNKPFGWTEGAARLYYTLAQDYLYEDASKNVVFLDNHDISRFYSMVNEDYNKFKMGISFLLTTRGIPMLYYGTEILMKNYANPDGKVREDFKGGWPKDSVNKFTKAGRTNSENDAFEFVKKLANYRKNNSVLQAGKLIQFVPEKGIYVYFRTNNEKQLMIIMNPNNDGAEVDLKRFDEVLKGRRHFKNIMDDKEVNVTEKISLQKLNVSIFEILL